MGREIQPFSPEEIAQRAFFTSLSDAIYTDPNDSQSLELAVSVAEEITNARAQENRRHNLNQSEGAAGTALLKGRPEEFRMFWVYHLGQFATDRISRHEDISPNEESYLYLGRLAAWAEDEIFRANTGLVLAKAGRLSATREGKKAEMVNAGNIGLHRTIELFNPHRGTKFSTYADQWIRQGFQRELPKLTDVINIPATVVSLMRRYRQVTADFVQKNGREMSDEEAAVELEIDVDLLRSERRKFNAVRGIGSFDKPLNDGGNATLGDVTPVPDALRDGFDWVESYDTLLALKRLAPSLKIREHDIEVLALNAGFFGVSYSFEEIARAQGGDPRTLERICRRTKRILAESPEIMELLTAN